MKPNRTKKAEWIKIQKENREEIYKYLKSHSNPELPCESADEQINRYLTSKINQKMLISANSFRKFKKECRNRHAFCARFLSDIEEKYEAASGAASEAASGAALDFFLISFKKDKQECTDRDAFCARVSHILSEIKKKSGAASGAATSTIVHCKLVVPKLFLGTEMDDRSRIKKKISEHLAKRLRFGPSHQHTHAQSIFRLTCLIERGMFTSAKSLEKYVEECTNEDTFCARITHFLSEIKRKSKVFASTKCASTEAASGAAAPAAPAAASTKVAHKLVVPQLVL
jgi:hypothetical protein